MFLASASSGCAAPGKCLKTSVVILAFVAVEFMTHNVVSMADDAHFSMSDSADLPDPFCMTEHATPLTCLRRRDDFSKLRRFLTQHCHWAPVETQATLIWSWQSFDALDTKTHRTGYIQYCDSMNDDGWLGLKVGPYLTAGDDEWFGAAAVINSTFLGTYRKDVHAWSHYAIGLTDADDNLIPYPPMHTHHVHLGQGGTTIMQGPHAHYETMCTSKEGGVRCLLHRAPAGYAYMGRSRIVPYGEFKDVRKALSNPMRAYFFVALKRVAKWTPVRQIQYQRFDFRDDSWSASFMQLHMAEFRMTPYLRQPDVQAVGFSFGTWDADMVANSFEVYFHTHPESVEDIWLFQGSPHEVFANVPTEQMNFGSDVYRLIGRSIEARQLKPMAAPVTCTYLTSIKTEWIVVRGELQRFDRFGGCTLLPHRLNWTMVVFHPYVPGKKAYLRTHTSLRLYWLRQETSIFLPTDPGLTNKQIAESASSHFNLFSSPSFHEMVFANWSVVL